jgi:hypothetical protein
MVGGAWASPEDRRAWFLDAGRYVLAGTPGGREEWAATYHTLRNTIEGINGVAKDGAYAALGDPRRRRIRGVAAQSVFAALLLMATNVKAIQSVLQRAVSDTAGVPRRPRKRRRTSRSVTEWTPTVVARSGAPPPERPPSLHVAVPSGPLASARPQAIGRPSHNPPCDPETR